MVRDVLSHARELARVDPADNDHHSALRVAVSVSIPLLTLLILGRPDLSIYAVFGGFTAMYGRRDTPRLRLLHQAGAATLLTAGLTMGVGLSLAHTPPATLVAVETVFAVAASLAADTMKLLPAGPFYSIFALGACASVPTTIPLWAATSICAASAAFSMVIGASGRIHHPPHTPTTTTPVAPAPVGTAAPRPRDLHLTAARYLLAVATAGAAGVAFGTGHANWTMAGAAVPLAAPNRKARIHRGIHRVVGTLAGVLLTAAILLPGFSSNTLTILLMALLFPTELFMTRHYGMAMMFFTPAILLMSQLAYPISRHTLITDRGLETLLGATIGMTIAILIRDPSPHTPPKPT